MRVYGQIGSCCSEGLAEGLNPSVAYFRKRVGEVAESLICSTEMTTVPNHELVERLNEILHVKYIVST